MGETHFGGYTIMTTEDKQGRAGTRQIVGFSLSPSMAREVKTEAAQRGLSLRSLFEEMWTLYLKERTDK